MSDRPGASSNAGGKQSDLYPKYEVRKDGEPVENCFVLEPGDDEAALEALKTYAKSTDNDFLAADLADWIVQIEGGSSE